MTSRLSSDHIQQLAPLLGSLARLVASGSQLSESELRTLLLGIDLEYDRAALSELKRWGRLLGSLYERPLPELRRATVEALMLRGLPEASVLLAVDTVISRPSKPSTPHHPSPVQQLRVSPPSLDFGTLFPGQPATGVLEIQGGPGQVVVESDQLRVTPLQFSAGTTSLRVEAKLLKGGVLWTSLKLVTRTETLEVPVLAQWTDIGPLDTTMPASTPDVPAAPAVPISGSHVQKRTLISSTNTRNSYSHWKSNRARTVLLTGLTLILVVSSIIGLMTLMSHANRVNADATATSYAVHNMNATATSRTLQNPYGGTLALDDPLRDNSKGYRWEWDKTTDSAGGSCEFIGGAYHISIPHKNRIEYCPADASLFYNFAYEVQMVIVEGDAGGIIFRLNNPGTTNINEYYFQISSSGSYEFWVYNCECNGNVQASKLSEGRSSAINAGLNHVNLIAVVAHSSNFQLYINHHWVATVSDNTYTHGKIALFALDDSNPTQVVFRNAKVWTY